MSEYVSQPHVAGTPPLRVEARRASQTPSPRIGLDPAADLDRVRKLAELLDAKFQVAGIKFGVDALVGLIPIVGDIFDVGFKANVRNLKLLEKALNDRIARPSAFHRPG